MKRVTLTLLVCMAALANARVVYETGFENGMELPPGWAIESHGPGPDWEFGGNPEDWLMRVRFGTEGEQDEWLVSPSLDLSGEAGVSVQFWQWFRTLGNGVGQLRVSVGGGPWETVIEYDSDQFGEPVVSVPQAGGQASVRFCWRYLASFDYQWDVDDVRVLSEVPVDMEVVGVRGPSHEDYLRQGADLVARVVFRNMGSQPSPGSTVRFTTSHGSVTANVPSGIAPNESLAVSFTVNGSLFAGIGALNLTVVVAAPGDVVASNDSAVVAPLHVIGSFPSPAATLLNYDDPADSTLFAGILAARGSRFDCWNRKQGGTDANLYGLEAWGCVVFTETEIYPALSEQIALMRFLDQASPGSPRGVLMSGDDWLRFYEMGVLSAEFVEDYLGMGGGQQITADMPDLYSVPGNALGLDRIFTTNASYPDVVAPNAQTPGADLALTYDELHSTGALGTYRAANYRAISAGFEWGQLIVQDEQTALAAACMDWLLDAAAEGSTGDALRLDIAPNPVHDRFVLRVSEGDQQGNLTARLIDMAGRRAASWRLPGAGSSELRIPAHVGSGAYCLVVTPAVGARGMERLERLVVWR